MSFLAFIAVIFGIIAVCFTAICIACIIKCPSKFVDRDDDDEDDEDDGEGWKNPTPTDGDSLDIPQAPVRTIIHAPSVN